MVCKRVDPELTPVGRMLRVSALGFDAGPFAEPGEIADTGDLALFSAQRTDCVAVVLVAIDDMLYHACDALLHDPPFIRQKSMRPSRSISSQ